MTTEKQKAASLANGARSRGPKTPQGKARAARNSLRHGLLARAVVLAGESRPGFDALVSQLNEALRPESAIEHLFVGKMAAAHWRQLRIWELERAGRPAQRPRHALPGETNPANAGPTGLSRRVEPDSSRVEPRSSRVEPDSSRPEPKEETR